MYSWGSGSHGQLGLGNLDDYEVPQPCISDLEVKRIVGGGSHTLLVSLLDSQVSLLNLSSLPSRGYFTDVEMMRMVNWV